MADALTAEHLYKSFNGNTVVQDVSFSVQEREVFGLIGPNGAGKTTTIRMLLHIIQPDRGDVALFGHPLDDAGRDRVGYLPEERGLYRHARAEDVLAYMGRLKGLSAPAAKKRAWEVLEMVGLAAHGKKKISQLSRGMGQLVQFGATVMHRPALVILDEPFSGLDPVNTEHLKEMVLNLQREGAAVIFSTHQMNQVEELCQRVLMINRGRAVLYGPVLEVKQRYRGDSLFITWNGPRDRVRGIARWEDRGTFSEAFLNEGATPESVLREMLDLGGQVMLFQLSLPSLNDVFIRVAGEVPANVP